MRFGFAGAGCWASLDARRAGAATKSIVRIEPYMAMKIKLFGRYKGGAIRWCACLRSTARTAQRSRQTGLRPGDYKDVLAAFELDE